MVVANRIMKLEWSRLLGEYSYDVVVPLPFPFVFLVGLLILFFTSALTVLLVNHVYNRSFGNVHDNFLTETDALTSDIHHVIEQQGRSNALGCFSFNGTGGIWRKDAIIAGGGFSSDTVTEDLDLSYKSHLAGYQFVYLPDLPQQLETPACVLAYKQQKNRWNKGYFQVYRKSMRHILECSHLPIVTRIEAFFHISR